MYIPDLSVYTNLAFYYIASFVSIVQEERNNDKRRLMIKVQSRILIVNFHGTTESHARHNVLARLDLLHG